MNDGLDRFRAHLFHHEGLGFWLDTSRILWPEGFLDALEPRLQAAYEAMAALERGAVANADENRMVGHYWLRAPDLSPTSEIATEIRTAIGDVQAFAFHPHARGTRQQIASAANFYTRAYGIYDLMIVADRRGIVVGANSVTADGRPLDTSSLIGRSVRGEEWFEECVSGRIRGGQSYIGDMAADPWVAQTTGGRGLSLNFSAPIFDEKGRMMAIICHNTDLGDGWEREGEAEFYFKEFSEPKAYPMGINIVFYAMTH